MNRRVFAAAAVALAAVVAAVAWFALGGDEDGAAGPTTTAPPLEVPGPLDPELRGDGQALVELLDARRTARYHAVYRGTDETGEGGELTIEVWRDGDRVRTDSRASDGTATAEARTIATPAGAIACNLATDGDWTCTASEQPVDDLGGFADQLAGVEVTERAAATEIAGQPARCFDFPSVDGTGEICAAANGVVLRLSVGSTLLEAISIDDAVSITDFEPPGPVS